MLRARARIYGNGSLFLRHLQPGDTDTYYCDVFVPDETKDTIIHNVIGSASVQFCSVQRRVTRLIEARLKCEVDYM